MFETFKVISIRRVEADFLETLRGPHESWASLVERIVPVLKEAIAEGMKEAEVEKG